MNHNRGKLYGVGVGPGDPELMTLKAIRIIEESDVIAVPGEAVEESVAYRIASQVCKDPERKEQIAIPMPMTKDAEKLRESHDKGVAVLRVCLDAGKQVAFLTLGDPTVYSTYLYLHKRLLEEGYAAEIVSGITSFCAAASKLDMGLVEKAQALHVLPASYPIEEALKLSGTKVLMKAGSKLGAVKQILQSQNIQAVMAENCGMPGEKLCRSTEEIPENAGYYSIIIVKDQDQSYSWEHR